MYDGIDLQIMNILQQDARTPNVEIARQLGMAPSAILERVRKLEMRGIITGYEARLAPRVLQQGLLAFIFVNADERYGQQTVGRQLAAIPEVQEVHHITGEDCYLVKMRAADTDALGQILRERFGAIESIRSTRTTIVLSSLKETAQLPLAVLNGEQAHD